MPSIEQEIVELIPQLRRFATALTRNSTAADDLVQDVLLRALSKIGQFQEGTNLRAWLLTITRNHYISEMRRYSARPPLTVVDGEAGSTPASQVSVLELRDLEAALVILPEEQRTTLLLVALEGLSYEEAAKVTEVAVGTVRSRVSRAREMLRRQLEGTKTATADSATVAKAAIGGDNAASQ